MFSISRVCLYGAVPGLRLIPDFVPEIAQKKLIEESLHLHNRIRETEASLRAQKTETYLSKQHNLTTPETFKFVPLKDVDGRKLDAQYFERYGEEGHQLTYFIKKIPSFVYPLIHRIEELNEVQALKTGVGSFDWNFTFNTYAATDQGRSVAGFPFHIDTPTNGDISAIYPLLSSVEMQMKKEDILRSFQLAPGSLLLLSGDARWKWEHRVVPREISGAGQVGSIHRISLVFGCKFIGRGL